MTVSVLLYAALACAPQEQGGGSPDGGSPDGGSSDGASTDGASTDGASTDGASTDGASTDGASTDGASTDGGTSDRPAIWSQVDPDLCEAVSGKEGQPGAASYVVGDFDLEAAQPWGTETWALFANSAWQAEGGADCVVTWTMWATLTETGACASCDYGLIVAGTTQRSATTCPGELYWKIEDRYASYDLDERDDGTVDWYSDGSLVGTGDSGDRLTYITPGECVWFTD